MNISFTWIHDDGRTGTVTATSLEQLKIKPEWGAREYRTIEIFRDVENFVFPQIPDDVDLTYVDVVGYEVDDIRLEMSKRGGGKFYPGESYM